MIPVFRILFFVLVVFLSGGNILLAQPLLNSDDLAFESDFEKQSFQTNEKSPLHLFLSLNSQNGNNLEWWERKLDQIHADLKAPVSRKKNLEKKVAVILDHLHKHQFLKYQEVANFQEMKEGTYNCVTSVAIFAMLLDRFEFKYQIVEQPDHVFLMVQGDQPIFVETTVSSEGVFMPSEKLQSKMVNALREGKVVSNSEVEEKGLSLVFRENFLSDENINLQQLAGLQYMNDALLKLNDNDYEGASGQYKKSWLLYPSERCQYMIYYLALVQFDNAGADLEKALSAMVEASKFQSDHMDLAAIHKGIEETISSWFKKSHEEKDLKAILGHLKNIPGDKSFSQETYFLYYSYQAADALTLKNTKEAYEHIAKAFKIYPEDKRTRGLFMELRVYNHVAFGGAQTVLDSLEVDEAKYPFFKESDYVQSLKLAALLEMARIRFSADEHAEGEGYLEAVDDLVVSRALPRNDEGYGFAYAAAVNFYVRQADYKTAKKYLQRGLELAPYSEKIIYLKRIYKKELGL